MNLQKILPYNNIHRYSPLRADESKCVWKFCIFFPIFSGKFHLLSAPFVPESVQRKMHYLTTLTLKVNAQGDTLQLQSQSAKYMAGSRANLLIAITSSCHFVLKKTCHNFMTWWHQISMINEKWKKSKYPTMIVNSQRNLHDISQRHHVTTRMSVNLSVNRGTLGTLPCSPDYEELESLGNHPRRVRLDMNWTLLMSSLLVFKDFSRRTPRGPPVFFTKNPANMVFLTLSPEVPAEDAEGVGFKLAWKRKPRKELQGPGVPDQ